MIFPLVQIPDFQPTFYKGLLEDFEERNMARILALIASSEKAIQRDWLAVISRMKELGELDDLARLISIGAIEEIVAMVEGLGTRLAASITANAYIPAAVGVANELERALLVIIDFDQTNFRAVRAMQTNQLRFVSDLSQNSRAILSDVMINGVEQGLNPITQARQFRASIGLTHSQHSAVENYRRLLQQGSNEALQRKLRDARFDNTIRNATLDNPIDPAKIDIMVERYRQRYVAYRSKVIARTESLRAVHEGSEEMLAQAIDSGHIDPTQITRTWNTAVDERVRGSHVFMHSQQRKLNEPFISGDGFALKYPGDPNAPGSEVIQCRCVVSTRIT